MQSEVYNVSHVVWQDRFFGSSTLVWQECKESGKKGRNVDNKRMFTWGE